MAGNFEAASSLIRNSSRMLCIGSKKSLLRIRTSFTVLSNSGFIGGGEGIEEVEEKLARLLLSAYPSSILSSEERKNFDVLSSLDSCKQTWSLI